MNNQTLTHFDSTGQAHMVDVGSKAETARVARAAGSIFMKPETLALIRSGSAKKGDVLGIARIAAIQASKRTGDLIPLCHPIALTRVAAEDVIHLYRPGRPEQHRALPWMHPVMTGLKMLAGFEESSLVAARVGAAKMGFFSSPDGNAEFFVYDKL